MVAVDKVTADGNAVGFLPACRDVVLRDDDGPAHAPCLAHVEPWREETVVGKFPGVQAEPADLVPDAGRNDGVVREKMKKTERVVEVIRENPRALSRSAVGPSELRPEMAEGDDGGLTVVGLELRVGTPVKIHDPRELGIHSAGGKPVCQDPVALRVVAVRSGDRDPPLRIARENRAEVAAHHLFVACALDKIAPPPADPRQQTPRHIQRARGS